MEIIKMAKEKIIKAGDEIVIETNLDAEVPYELVKKYDATGNGRLFTRNIREKVKEIKVKKEE